MNLKIIIIFFHTLLVVSSARRVKGDSDYRSSEQGLRKQKRTDLSNGHSHFPCKDLSKLQHTVVTLPEGSIGQINQQRTENSNQYKGLAKSIQEKQQLVRTISDTIAVSHGEFSKFKNDELPLKICVSDAKGTGTPESTQPDASTSHCGGRLLGESGVISYKEYETYNDEENCTWIIEVPGALKIGFKFEKTGLEDCCDHVHVTSLDTAGLAHQAPIQLKSYHTVFVDGPNAMVRFNSDTGFNGLGFRLSYYKVTDLNCIIEEAKNKNVCGGVIVGETGEISYKFDEHYKNKERCVWLVHSPNSTSITFHLRQPDLETDCFVSITTIDPETGTLRNDTQVLWEWEVIITIQESLAVVVFSTEDTSSWESFLTFWGSGINTNHKYVYKLLHIAEPNATIEYSASERNDDGDTKQQHIYVTAKSAKGNTQLSESFISEVDLNAGVFFRANHSSCVYDSLTFYKPIVTEINEDYIQVWQKKAQIPNENDILLCPEKFSVPKQKALLDFGVHSFLAIYKRITHKCVEIVQPLENEFGIITYKGKGNYSNEENCGWIIDVPNATRIDFNLEQSGFHEIYDDLVVTSLDMAGQVQGATINLRAGHPTASVTGSRALVIFKSDRTNIESGFRLRYGSGISLEENVCGGVLNPMLDFGVISYKANENFANNENCEWKIETPEWGRIGFILERSGFESWSDFLSVGSLDSNGTEIGRPINLYFYNRTASLAGPNALVRFFTDESGTGTGFRLRYEKLPADGH